MAALANMNTPLTRRDDRKARREERFFFRIACAMAIVLVSGFSVHLMAGRSSFDVPLVSHLHAAVFFGWIVLFLVQTGLMTSGNIAMHRRLGWLSALWVQVTIALGSTMSLTSLQRSGGPFFFAANDFLLGNIIGLITFGCMVGAALAMRRRSDWHRGLMLRAMASMTGPGFGRLLPMPLLMPFAWEPSNMMGMVFSSREISTTGRTLA